MNVHVAQSLCHFTQQIIFVAFLSWRQDKKLQQQMEKTIILLTTWNTSYIIILRSKLGGGHLKERKKPGPHPEKPLAHDLKVRVDDETMAKVEFCMKELNLTRSEVLRKGVHTLYDGLPKK